MNRLFRKIRLTLLNKNQKRNYFKYAIGEIFLVVVGILIALQINNWNENRKDKIYKKTVYAQIQQDLQRDTLYINNIIEYYTKKNVRLEEIINREIPESYYDTINEINYKNCKKCICDLTTNNFFSYSDKGYQLLKLLNESHNTENDSLSYLILDFYNIYIPSLEFDGQILKDIMNETIDEFQKYDWYVDWAYYQKVYNKEYLKYIFESEEYRKKCVRYLIYSKSNYLRDLITYRKYAVELLMLLDKEYFNIEFYEREKDFTEKIETKGIDKATEYYKTFKKNKKNKDKLLFSERTMNILGYSYLKKNDLITAIKIFQLNAAEHPNSFNVYDCLGEAYLANGEKEKAIENYKKSIELNPNNENGIKILRTLTVPNNR
jgi:tetratricopeptide (TPR) repeat protein